MIACGCGQTFRDSATWSAHEKEGRRALPRGDAESLRVYMAAHIASIAVVRVRDGLRPVATETREASLDEKIRDVNAEIEAVTLRLGLLELRREALLREKWLQSEDLASAQTVRTPTWKRHDIRVSCVKCGVKTAWRLDGAGRCHPECRVREVRVATDTVMAKDTAWMEEFKRIMGEGS